MIVVFDRPRKGNGRFAGEHQYPAGVGLSIQDGTLCILDALPNNGNAETLAIFAKGEWGRVEWLDA